MFSLIKTSKIPIICMCNDRNHQKIRSLANYCFDLRFQRPRVEQIKVSGPPPPPASGPLLGHRLAADHWAGDQWLCFASYGLGTRFWLH